MEDETDTDSRQPRQFKLHVREERTFAPDGSDKFVWYAGHDEAGIEFRDETADGALRQLVTALHGGRLLEESDDEVTELVVDEIVGAGRHVTVDEFIAGETEHVATELMDDDEDGDGNG